MHEISHKGLPDFDHKYHSQSQVKNVITRNCLYCESKELRLVECNFSQDENFATRAAHYESKAIIKTINFAHVNTVSKIKIVDDTNKVEIRIFPCILS